MSKVQGVQVITFDQDVQNKFDELQSRRQRLNSRMNEVGRQISQLTNEVGLSYADGGPWQELDTKLVKLQREVNAIDGAIHHVDGQISLLRRGNVWLVSR